MWAARVQLAILHAQLEFPRVFRARRLARQSRSHAKRASGVTRMLHSRGLIKSARASWREREFLAATTVSPDKLVPF